MVERQITFHSFKTGLETLICIFKNGLNQHTELSVDRREMTDDQNIRGHLQCEVTEVYVHKIYEREGRIRHEEADQQIRVTHKINDQHPNANHGMNSDCDCYGKIHV